MHAEILIVGTEILLGHVVDTNASLIGRVLAENGIDLYQKTTVGDNRGRICRALNDALDRSEAVLVSGGLGPTADDITRECVAEVLGCPLEFRQELLDHIARRFARRHRAMTENNRKQAYVPRDAIVLENRNGTAPGFIVEHARGRVICMPGVPSELEAMLTHQVVPYLRRAFAVTAVIHSRVLKVFNVGESAVDTAIGDLVDSEQNPTVGLLASPGAVCVRLTAKAKTVEEADRMIDRLEAVIRTRLPGLTIGTDGAASPQ
ncbi:MAG TPA: CinA family nicotinamide mononucleotide deamidase-related protein [Candidatus Hydrogenedentes bacterium]|nr:CinA family nicotinamide mononucleotide deamidase-related protein [Candidatus Hydrogenedentota bacterium]